MLRPGLRRELKVRAQPKVAAVACSRAMEVDPATINAAALVMPCARLHETLEFFRARLGFRVDAIYPADDPREVELSGHGLRLHLRRVAADPGAAPRLRVVSSAVSETRELVAPNGARVELVPATPTRAPPPLREDLVITHDGEGARWVVGRAGMQYRDLIPGRLGGRVIASHIRIPAGGPVPDSVHFHEVRFQLIFCYRGWVRVVYEDQGPPFVLRAGDCVLQPPRIRHRVLESSPGLEVIEIGCPAEHPTRLDHALALPTAALDRTRAFSGQRFVRHEVAGARYQPWRAAGFEARDAGIAAATGGLADVRVARRRGDTPPAPVPLTRAGELLLLFVLAGEVSLETQTQTQTQAPERLRAGACVSVPPGAYARLIEPSPALELLEVTLPQT